LIYIYGKTIPQKKLDSQEEQMRKNKSNKQIKKELSKESPKELPKRGEYRKDLSVIVSDAKKNKVEELRYRNMLLSR
jgi:hypothetical protein